MQEAGTVGANCCTKVASGRKAASTINSLFNARGLQFKYTKALHEPLLMPVLTYSNETMILE